MNYKILILLLFANITFGQVNTQEYIGTILAKNQPPISFMLNLEEKNGQVKGYSLTNLENQNKTKSEVQGIYLKKDKVFQIYETQIISTESESSLKSFCYLNMVLTKKSILNKKRLEGTFKGYFSDNKSCAEGQIILIEKEYLEKKIKKKIIKMSKEKIDTNFIKKTKILSDKENFKIEWNSKFLILKIWDSNQEDGDKISINLNGENLLYNYQTKKKAKKIKYSLKKGRNVLQITATSLGVTPPNTSRVELIDKDFKYPILTQLELNKTAEVIILR